MHLLLETDMLSEKIPRHMKPPVPVHDTFDHEKAILVFILQIIIVTYLILLLNILILSNFISL